jgi:hypothetical protein
MHQNSPYEGTRWRSAYPRGSRAVSKEIRGFSVAEMVAAKVLLKRLRDLEPKKTFEKANNDCAVPTVEHRDRD